MVGLRRLRYEPKTNIFHVDILARFSDPWIAELVGMMIKLDPKERLSFSEITGRLNAHIDEVDSEAGTQNCRLLFKLTASTTI